MCLFRFCWTWCMNWYMYVYMLLCMNLMNVNISILCFVSDCVFFYKLNVYCVFYPAVTGELMSANPSSSDRKMTSARPSLLWATVATDVFGPSLPSYNCSNALVVTGLLPVATVTYDPLLQCLIVVVITCAWIILLILKREKVATRQPKDCS
jgi:hypothetical protein